MKLPVASSIPKIGKVEDLHIVSDALASSNTVDFDDYTTPEYEESVEDKPKVLKKKRVKSKPHFAVVLANDAKNHFGGVPRATRANELSVMKYVVSKCKDHKLTVLQTRQVCSMAFPLVFTPDSNDKFVAEFLNHSTTFERREDYAKSLRVDSCWMGLLKKPWGAKQWKNVIKRLAGMEVQTAYLFVK